MITPFKDGNRITQRYKNNPAYYAQFGLKGHEGMDITPVKSSTNKDIFCIEGGEIIKDIDDPRGGGAYGNHIVIWNKANKRAWYYCHMESNQVSNKQTIRRGDKIGVMGATGNTNGAHLHLNLCETNENGVRLNKDNGYLGFIDPEPTLNELNNGNVIISPPTDKMDYKAIFDNTGNIKGLEDRKTKPDFYAPDDEFKKAYVDKTNGDSFVVVNLKSLNDTLSFLRDEIAFKTKELQVVNEALIKEKVKVEELQKDIKDLIENDPLAPDINLDPIIPPFEVKPNPNPTINITGWLSKLTNKLFEWFK